MKVNILITLVFSLISLVAFSQLKNLTSPKAKNSYSKKHDCDTSQFIAFKRIIDTGSKLKCPQF